MTISKHFFTSFIICFSLFVSSQFHCVCKNHRCNAFPFHTFALISLPHNAAILQQKTVVICFPHRLYSLPVNQHMTLLAQFAHQQHEVSYQMLPPPTVPLTSASTLLLCLKLLIYLPTFQIHLGYLLHFSSCINISFQQLHITEVA